MRKIRLFHLADIHIQDRRREEYKVVFEKARLAIASEIASEEPTENIVVIAGDLFDTKTKISAQNLTDVADFLAMLDELAPVVLIPGNHDMNMNRNSMDLITPIAAEFKRNNRTTYWRHSGVYTALGIEFTVVSPDEALPPISGKPDEANVPRVCILHEEIEGAGKPILEYLNPPGRGSYGLRLAVEDLAGFDAVLAGHIHFPQTMGENIAYCGSLVQQNFGESHRGHGFLVWEIVCGDGTAVQVTKRFVEIPNDRGFLTVEYNNSVDVTPDGWPEFPNATRVRYSGCDQAFLTKEVGSLIECFGAIRDVTCVDPRPSDSTAAESIRFPREIIGNSPEDTGGRDGHRGNQKDFDSVAVDDIQVHYDVIRDILGSDNPNLDDMLAMHKKHWGDKTAGASSETDDIQRTRKVRWTIKEFQFRNMFCYASGNVVDFTRMHGGVNGIIAPNRAGKSSLVDAIVFTLYDKPPRGKKKMVANISVPEFSSKITLDVGGKTMVIMKSGGRTGAISTKFWYDNVEGTEATTKETCEAIHARLGKFSEAMSTAFALQSRENSFVDMSSSDRSKLIFKFLQFDNFTAIKKTVGNELLRIKGQIKEVSVLAVPIPPLVEKLAQARGRCARKTSELENLKVELTKMTKNKEILMINFNIELSKKTAIRRVSEIENELGALVDDIGSVDVALAERRLAELSIDLLRCSSDPGRPMVSEARQLEEVKKYKAVAGRYIDMLETETGRAALNEANKRAGEILRSIGRVNEPMSARPADPTFRPAGDLATWNSAHQSRCSIRLEQLRAKQLDIGGRNRERVEDSAESDRELTRLSKMTLAPPPYDKDEHLRLRALVSKNRGASKSLPVDSGLNRRRQNAVDVLARILPVQEEVAAMTIAELDRIEPADVRFGEGAKQLANVELLVSTAEALVSKTAQQTMIRFPSEIIEANARRLDSVEILSARHAEYVAAVAAQETARALLRQRLDNEISAVKATMISAQAVYDWAMYDRHTKSAEILARTDATIKYASMKESVSAILEVTKIKAEISSIERVVRLSRELVESTNYHNNEKIRDQLLVSKREINAQTARILASEAGVREELNLVDNTEIEIERARNYTARLSDLKILEMRCKEYRALVGDKPGSIPFQLLHRLTPILERCMNDVLHEYADFEVSLTDSHDIYLGSPARAFDSRKPSGTQPRLPENMGVSIDLASGYQKFAVDVASRIGLMEIAAVPLPDCLIIDEGFGCLDGENIQYVGNFLKNLAKRRLLLVISHVEGLLPFIDRPLYVEQTPGGTSTVNNSIEFRRNSDEEPCHVGPADVTDKIRAYLEDVRPPALGADDDNWQAIVASSKHADDILRKSGSTSDEIIGNHRNSPEEIGVKFVCDACKKPFLVRNKGKHFASKIHLKNERAMKKQA